MFDNHYSIPKYDITILKVYQHFLMLLGQCYAILSQNHICMDN